MTILSTFNKKCLVNGKMARWLRALAALAEDPGLVPRNYMAASISGNGMPSFGFYGHQPHNWCTYIYSGTHTYTYNYFVKKGLTIR